MAKELFSDHLTKENGENQPLIYLDDSSDEEDNTKISIKKLFEKFIKDKAYINVEQFRHAFYAHALGIKILRSPLVKSLYYKEKEKYLKYEDDFLKDDLVKQLIHNSLKKIIMDTFFAFPGDNLAVSEALTNDFFQHHGGVIDKFINGIINNKKLLALTLSKKNHFLKLNELLTDDVKSIIEEVDGYIAGLPNNAILNSIRFADQKKINYMELADNKAFQALIKDIFERDIDACISIFVKTKEGNISASAPNKANYIKNINYFNISQLVKWGAEKYINNSMPKCQSVEDAKTSIMNASIHYTRR